MDVIALVRKCCPFDTELINHTCIESGRVFEINADFEYAFEIGRDCPSSEPVPVLTFQDDLSELSLTPDGSLKVIFHVATNITKYYDRYHYCIDNIEESLGALLCYPDADDHNYAGMLISIPFLLITFLVHWILPERNLHMKALMFYVLNLMLSYVFLVTIELSSSLPPTLCSVLGYMCLFFFVSSIFWINVICIDIWLTFSGFLGIQGGKKENKRLIYYSAYAIALPLLLMLIIFLINMFGDETKSYYPDIGGTQCFLKEGLPYLLYFHGPMGLLLCVNIIFFTLTALKIRSVKKETAMLKKGGNRTTTENTEKYYLYLKLLFAMGLNWSLETISWIFENYTTAPKWIWYLTDFCNAVYGLVIFLIFVCKRRTWKVLKKRYYQFTGRPHLAQTMSTSTTQQTRVTSASVSDAPTNGETVRLAAYK